MPGDLHYGTYSVVGPVGYYNLYLIQKETARHAPLLLINVSSDLLPGILTLQSIETAYDGFSFI